MDEIGLTHADLPTGASNSGQHGAVVHFSGIVRGLENGNPIEGIRYSAYESMAEAQLQAIVASVRQELGVDFPVKLVHRLGFVPTGIASVTLEIATPHSREAFEFCQKLLHKLKTEVPIWKEFVYTETNGPD